MRILREAKYPRHLLRHRCLAAVLATLLVGLVLFSPAAAVELNLDYQKLYAMELAHVESKVGFKITGVTFESASIDRPVWGLYSWRTQHIKVNSKVKSPSIIRMTIAHELGHHLLITLLKDYSEYGADAFMYCFGSINNDPTFFDCNFFKIMLHVKHTKQVIENGRVPLH